ncbi:MAG: hypothetical protein IJR54_06445 [Oscillibacter sp.]|nr:hypothetical protein [Oscillibacter sp.]
MNANVYVEELPQEVQNAYEAANCFPLALGILLFALFLGNGLLCLRKPEIVWRIRHLWSVEGGKPTDFYIFSIRVSGAVSIIIGVVLLVSVFV